MLSASFSPFGRYKRIDLLRSSFILYLSQIIWAIIIFVVLYYFKDESSKHLLTLISGSYFVFFYLYICAFAKRLRALSHNLNWLIPIGIVFCWMFFITAMLSVELLTPNATHFIEKQYLLIGLNTFSFNALSFLGCLLTSIAVACLPENKAKLKLSGT